jgi:hypothetical protein
MRKISRSVRKPKQAKKKWMTVQSVQFPVACCLYRPYDRTDDVAAPGDDTWQVMWRTTDNWTSQRVTRVTTVRVTRGIG